MKEQNDFADNVSATEQAQAHAEEIKQTRIGGLGGSDAAMVLRIADKGLANISITDEKRLAVMLGLAEQDAWAGNAHTQAGHLFEDWAEAQMLEDALDNNNGMPEREYKIEAKLARNFNVFAHADFYNPSTAVVGECKFVQKPFEKVVAEYYAQIQWYYMLGAKNVVLIHGQGTAEPFNVTDATYDAIGRDEVIIVHLLAGLKIIDNAIDAGWRPSACDRVNVDTTPLAVRSAFETLKRISAQKAELERTEKEAKATILEYMQAFGASTIFDDDCKATITRESTTRTFDSKKFLKAHPEYEVQETFYKTAQRAAFITFK